MIEDLKVRDFAAALERVPSISFNAAVTRFAWEVHRSSITSTLGARQTGGRWNVPGVRSLYTSMTREAALAEFTYRFAPTQPLQPASMVSLVLDLRHVVDFTQPAMLAALSISLGDLVVPQDAGGYRVPRHLGSLAYGAKVDGLVVPSAVLPGETNVVVLIENCVATPVVIVAARETQRILGG